MQDEAQTPGGDAQETNNAPDPWGDAANLEGFEEFDQEQPSGEEAADVVGKKLPPWMVRTAAGATAEEVDQFAPEGLAAESEDPAAAADFSDPALYDTGVADPWGGTPPPGTVEQVEESVFTPPWEDPNAPPPGAAEQEEGGSFNPLFSASWEDLGVPSPGAAEQEGESIFTPLWEDPNAPPSGTVEQEGEEPAFTAPWEDASAAPDPSAFAVGWDNALDTTPEGQEEEPAFAAPWEDASAAPDPDTSTFAVGWDSVPDTTPEGQEDDSTAVGEEMLNPLDAWSDPSGVAEETTAAGDIWDTTEGLIEDVSEAFEDVSEAIEDVFDDTF